MAWYSAVMPSHENRPVQSLLLASPVNTFFGFFGASAMTNIHRETSELSLIARPEVLISVRNQGSRRTVPVIQVI